jgi:hydroxyacylglutathione hydrolase
MPDVTHVHNFGLTYDESHGIETIKCRTLPDQQLKPNYIPMYFQHVFDKSLAQSSYLIGCQATGEAIVIDAQRDIDVYTDLAKRNNLKITHIAETHIHADFLCGSRELAAVTGAIMYLSDEGGKDWQYEFPHVGLKDGSIIKVGNLSLKVIHTPGHTPESISFLLTDHPATDKPAMILTGDFVFVGDIGRPDLLEKAAGILGTKEEGAKQMYQSLKKFAALPEFIQVWPAHGAGSACGKALGAVPSSTVGYEKIANWAFQNGSDEAGFTAALLEGQPEPPKYFAMMKKLNKVDRPLLIKVPVHRELSKEDFLSAYKKGIKVINLNLQKGSFRVV